MRIIIVGGGKTGAYLAEQLHQEHEVVIVEQRKDRVGYLRSALPDVETVLGDACEPDVLEAVDTRDSDMVIAVTGHDEDNLVVAMLTKVLEGGTVYARINHPRNAWLFDKEWGVDVPVSSPAMLYGLIARDIMFGDVIPLLDLKADDVSVGEVKLPKDAGAVGSRLADISLPANVTVIAVIAAEGGARPARGDTLLNAGDELLLLTQGSTDEAAILSALGIECPEKQDLS